MLIKFKVRNFRSLLGEQVFSFAASSDKVHAATHCLYTGFRAVPRVSKTAVVFGPNGSGKSNLLHALSVMRDLVLHSGTFSSREFAERHTPFLLDQAQDRPTEFEVDLVLGANRYQYAFSYTNRMICSERLLVFSTGKAQRWFERSLDPSHSNPTWLPFSAAFGGPKALWRNATRPQALFLTTAAKLNGLQLQPLFRWFEEGMEFLFGSSTFDPWVAAACVEDPPRKAALLRFLQATGFSIHDIRLSESQGAAPADASRPTSVNGRHGGGDKVALEYSHRRDDGASVWLQSVDESAGVQRLLQLFGPLSNAVTHGQLLCIDEFDLSLHPLVGRYLIQLLNDPAVSVDGAQLLLTSHNTTLMDMGILRRDEIWLMELNTAAASTLRRMWHSPSPPRKDELIGKQYLIGRYGALPAIHAPRAMAAQDTGVTENSENSENSVRRELVS